MLTTRTYICVVYVYATFVGVAGAIMDSIRPNEAASMSHVFVAFLGVFVACALQSIEKEVRELKAKLAEQHPSTRDE